MDRLVLNGTACHRLLPSAFELASVSPKQEMRTCLFCDQPVSSKEHVWPQWLLRLLRELRELHRHLRATIHSERRGEDPRSWSVVDDGLTVKFVCRTCNNGWMSNLETRAKSIIERLMGEGSVTLDASDQQLLSAWAVKNAMVFEALRAEPPRFYTDEERRAFRETQIPPSRTSVWIAKCVDQPNAYCSASDLSGLIEGTSRRVQACVTTMAFGSLAIQVLSGKLPADIPTTTTVTGELGPGPGDWDEVVVRICPRSDGVVWPPAIGLSGDLGIEAFSERWSPT